MAKPCLICADPGVRDSVDRQLAEGVSIRDCSALVKRSRSAIGRHKLHGDDERDERGVKLSTPKPLPKFGGRRIATMRAEPSQSGQQVGQEPIETRTQLVSRFQALLDEATQILMLAKRRGDSRLALQALKDARESVLHIGKALGLIAPDGATLVDARRQSIALLSRLNEAELRAYLASLTTGADATDNKAFSVALPVRKVRGTTRE